MQNDSRVDGFYLTKIALGSPTKTKIGSIDPCCTLSQKLPYTVILLLIFAQECLRSAVAVPILLECRAGYEHIPKNPEEHV